ncbi:MAG: PIN domain-containing protein [Thermodesulfovibrionia bacterium]|nr:PIN domain-containing protein [Thermodesulfovibrionia bacterium]
MEYLADTVTIIRYFAKTGKIGKRAKAILNDAEKGKHRIFISVLSLVEIMYLSQKMRISINLAETLTIINNSENYMIVDLNSHIVLFAESIRFPELFDRLILATGEYLGVPVITPDEEIHELESVEAIWQ